ncbi:MAG: hypothetical protein JHC33_04960, partial [Ignisphaera sp.]|nr:hypothetical protein [Ignisphaera sp.]
IQADYTTGAYSLRELGDKHSVEHSTINKRAKKEGWVEVDKDSMKKAVQATIALKTIESNIEQFHSVPQFHKAVENLADITITQKRVASKLFNKIEQMVDEVSDFREVKDLATAFAQTSSPFKDDRTQIAVVNNNEVSSITRKIID